MSDDTWALVQRKRDVRAHLADLQSTQNMAIKAAFFHSWRSGSTRESTESWNKLTAAQDKVIAKTLFEFRELGKQVTKALRADDVALFQGLMAEGASFTGPRQARDLWRVVRRSLPKTKAKRAQQQPLKIVALEDQWIPHLCTLETGRVVTPDELLDYDKHLSIPTVPSCHQDDLPSLQRLESSFRATAPHKATGMDPVPSHVFHDCAPVLAKRFFSLLIKEYLWGEEPVQWKGGNPLRIARCGKTSIIEMSWRKNIYIEKNAYRAEISFSKASYCTCYRRCQS